MRGATSLLLLTALALPACGATSGIAPGPSAMPELSVETPAETAPAMAGDRGQLASQDLAIGSCATFFWTADTARRFVAFENETEGYARVYANGRVHEFSTPPRAAMHATGDPYRREYGGAGHEPAIRISGTIGDPLPQGQRIDHTVMHVMQPDGHMRVIPLVGHYACRSVQVE